MYRGLGCYFRGVDRWDGILQGVERPEVFHTSEASQPRRK